MKTDTFTESNIIIKEDGVVVKGSECNIEGNDNKIYGSKCNIKGNDNVVLGEKCTITGNYNTIYGYKCIVVGNYNVVYGEKCKIKGFRNTNHRESSEVVDFESEILGEETNENAKCSKKGKKSTKHDLPDSLKVEPHISKPKSCKTTSGLDHLSSLSKQGLR